MRTVAALFIDPRDADRFWSKVDRSGPVLVEALGPCWMWLASSDGRGYGQFTIGSKVDGTRRAVRAHRYAWATVHGDPGPLCACHRCDNPKCVRPDHLFLGTVADNNRDMWTKGRGVQSNTFADESLREKATLMLPRGAMHYARTNPERLARGERHGKTNLTVERVREIRTQREQGVSLRVLAARYGLTAGGVSAIVHRRNWRHVP